MLEYKHSTHAFLLNLLVIDCYFHSFLFKNKTNNNKKNTLISSVLCGFEEYARNMLMVSLVWFPTLLSSLPLIFFLLPSQSIILYHIQSTCHREIVPGIYFVPTFSVKLQNQESTMTTQSIFLGKFWFTAIVLLVSDTPFLSHKVPALPLSAYASDSLSPSFEYFIGTTITMLKTKHFPSFYWKYIFFMKYILSTVSPLSSPPRSSHSSLIQFHAFLSSLLKNKQTTTKHILEFKKRRKKKAQEPSTP